jgi:hypothetical protein
MRAHFLLCLVLLSAVAFAQSGGDISIDYLNFSLLSSPGEDQIELLVFDPSHHAIGKDALSKKSFNSSANAAFGNDGQEDLGINISTPSGRHIEFRDPKGGVYRVEVTSTASNGPAKFSLYISSECGPKPIVGRVDLQKLVINPGERKIFRVRFDDHDCAKLSLLPPPKRP